MTDAIAAIRRYVEMRQAQPLKGLGDSVHSIHSGTEYEAELRFSDLEAVVATIQASSELSADAQKENASLGEENCELRTRLAEAADIIYGLLGLELRSGEKALAFLEAYDAPSVPVERTRRGS